MCFIIIDGYILYIPILIYLTMSLLMVNKVSDISYLKVMLWTFSHIHSCIFSSYFFGSISASGSAVSKVTDIRILIPMARWLPKKLTNLQSQWKERVFKWRMSRNMDFPSALLTQWPSSAFSETSKRLTTSRIVTTERSPLCSP